MQVTEAKDGTDVVFLHLHPASGLNAADAIGYKPVFFGVDGMDGRPDHACTSMLRWRKNGLMLLTPSPAERAERELTKLVGK